MVCRPRCTSRQGPFLLCSERFSQCPWRKAAHATPPMYGKYWNNSRRISLTLWPKSERCSWSRWAWMWRKLKFSSWMQEPKIRKRQDCLLMSQQVVTASEVQTARWDTFWIKQSDRNLVVFLLVSRVALNEIALVPSIKFAAIGRPWTSQSKCLTKMWSDSMPSWATSLTKPDSDAAIEDCVHAILISFPGMPVSKGRSFLSAWGPIFLPCKPRYKWWSSSWCHAESWHQSSGEARTSTQACSKIFGLLGGWKNLWWMPEQLQGGKNVESFLAGDKDRNLSRSLCKSHSGDCLSIL